MLNCKMEDLMRNKSLNLNRNLIKCKQIWLQTGEDCFCQRLWTILFCLLVPNFFNYSTAKRKLIQRLKPYPKNKKKSVFRPRRRRRRKPNIKWSQKALSVIMTTNVCSALVIWSILMAWKLVDHPRSSLICKTSLLRWTHAVTN